MPLQEGKRAATTAERWQQVHDLRAQNVGLLECARRLNLSPSTVKRYDRASEPERLRRVPKYRPTLVDPYRDHLRKRRADEPGVPVRQLLREIRELGYQGSSNLLVRYISQGRLEGDRPHLSPRRAARILLTRPDRLTAGQHETLAGLTAACPEMTALTSLITSFAALLAPDPGNDARLRQWIADARAAGLPHVHSFTRGLDLDIQAATAALTMPHHNGRTEGVNTMSDQDDQKTDVRTRRLHPAAPPDPSRMKLRTVTTESATEPRNRWFPLHRDDRRPGQDHRWRQRLYRPDPPGTGLARRETQRPGLCRAARVFPGRSQSRWLTHTDRCSGSRVRETTWARSSRTESRSTASFR
jgi:hypothetical protein